MPRFLPRVIALSLRLYVLLLRLAPADFRRDYARPALQVFRQCCLDAYARGGAFAVLALWPGLFGDALLGALAERLSIERMIAMLPSIRRALLVTFGAFVLFGLAYIALQQIVDPRPPYEALASVHPDLNLAFRAFVIGADLAFVAVAGGGLVLLFTAARHALRARKREVLRPLALAALLLVLFVAGVGLLLLLPRPILIDGRTQLAFVAFALFCLVIGCLALARVVLRSDFSPPLLRFALIPMALATLGMGLSCVAALTWLLRLWSDAPAFAASQGMGPGLSGGPGGGAGAIVTLIIMALCTLVAALALVRGLRLQGTAA